ncbi:MAG TPA: hypothetical protein ENL27_02905 [Candidatus Parcubacteria bacterium]|nr:hypothetical protein [Candidatus Parcubacteria bacterium]
MRKKILFLGLIFLLGLTMAVPRLIKAEAQPPTVSNDTETVNSLYQPDQEAVQGADLDENVTPDDLEIEKPRLLPTSPFYFLKEWTRRVRLFFTFNQANKLKLQSKFANEKLMEIKETIEKNKNQGAIEKAASAYQKQIDKVQEIAEKIKGNPKAKDEAKSFLEKWMRHQILHQKLLQELKKRVPPQTAEKIEETRNRHLKRFRDVMLKLEDKNKLPERLEKAVEGLRGSSFKEIKALEILKEIEDKTPKKDKKTIENARKRLLKRLQDRLEKIPEDKRGALKNYMEKVSENSPEGTKIIQEIINTPKLKNLEKEILKTEPERERETKTERERNNNKGRPSNKPAKTN